MNLARLRAVALPALGTLAALIALLACAESSTTSNPDDGEQNQTDDDASIPKVTPEAGPDVEGGSTDRDASVRGTCSSGGFCTTPLPVSFPLFALAARDSEAWALGARGILRWDGGAWSHVYATTIDPTGAHHGVWTAKEDDVWVATDKKIVRYSKQGTTAPAFREYPNTLAVQGSWLDTSTNVLWEVVRQTDGLSAVHRFRDAVDDGVTAEDGAIPIWPAEGGSYRWSSIWGFGSTDVYVGGERCMIDDCTWSPWALRAAIAHYDGTTWSVTLLDEQQSLLGIVGTPGASEPRSLWLWVGYRTLYNPSTTSLRFVPIESDGSFGAPVVTKEMPMPPAEPSMKAPCSHVLGSMQSANAGWLSNGCLLYRWDGNDLEPTGTAINGIPVGRVNALQGSGAGVVWIAGEGLESGVGFAARRAGGSQP